MSRRSLRAIQIAWKRKSCEMRWWSAISGIGIARRRCLLWMIRGWNWDVCWWVCWRNGKGNCKFEGQFDLSLNPRFCTRCRYAWKENRKAKGKISELNVGEDKDIKLTNLLQISLGGYTTFDDRAGAGEEDADEDKFGVLEEEGCDGEGERRSLAMVCCLFRTNASGLFSKELGSFNESSRLWVPLPVFTRMANGLSISLFSDSGNAPWWSVRYDG